MAMAKVTVLGGAFGHSAADNRAPHGDGHAKGHCLDPFRALRPHELDTRGRCSRTRGIGHLTSAAWRGARARARPIVRIAVASRSEGTR